jgi:ribonuclease HI
MDLNFEYLKIFFDGGSRSNPGPSAVGAVIYDKNDNRIAEISEFIGEQTNNMAEYIALEKTLEYIKKYKAKYNIRRIILNTDSKLIHNQLKKIWKIRDDDLREISKRIARRLKEYDLVDLRLIPRKDNKVADKLVNAALDNKLKGLGSRNLLDADGIKFGPIED